MKIIIKSSFGLALMVSTANSSDSIAACSGFVTNTERKACEIGYQAGRSAGGSEGMKISELRRSRFGGLVIVPNENPGSEGHRVIGIPGSEGFEVDRFPLLSEWLKTYNVDSELKLYATESIKNQSATNVVESPFQFKVEKNSIKELKNLRDDNWKVDNSTKFTYQPLLKQFASQAE